MKPTFEEQAFLRLVARIKRGLKKRETTVIPHDEYTVCGSLPPESIVRRLSEKSGADFLIENGSLEARFFEYN